MKLANIVRCVLLSAAGLSFVGTCLAQSSYPTFSLKANPNHTVTFVDYADYITSSITDLTATSISNDVSALYSNVDTVAGGTGPLNGAVINGINNSVLTGAYANANSVTSNTITVTSSIAVGTTGLTGTITQGQTASETIGWSLVLQTDGNVHLVITLSVSTLTGSYSTGVNVSLPGLTAALVHAGLIPSTSVIPAPQHVGGGWNPPTSVNTWNQSQLQAALNAWSYYQSISSANTPDGTVTIGNIQQVE